MSNDGLKLIILMLAFIALAGLSASSSAQSPIADGLSEVRVGVVDKADFGANLVVVDGRRYSLVESQREVLGNLLGSAINEHSDNIRMQSVATGDRIRYVVDLMTERLGHEPPELFILGFEE